MQGNARGYCRAVGSHTRTNIGAHSACMPGAFPSACPMAAPFFHFRKGDSPSLPCPMCAAGPEFGEFYLPAVTTPGGAAQHKRKGEPTPSGYHPRWCHTTQTKSSYLSPPQPAVALPQQWYYPICVQWSVQSTCNKPCNLRAIAIFMQSQSACTCNTSSNQHTKYSHVSSMYDHTRYDQAVACYSVRHSLLLLLDLYTGLESAFSGGGAKVRSSAVGLVLGGGGGSTCYPHAPPSAGNLQGGGGGNCSRTPPPARRAFGGVVGG